jgi:hypothetical protein
MCRQFCGWLKKNFPGEQPVRGASQSDGEPEMAEAGFLLLVRLCHSGGG